MPAPTLDRSSLCTDNISVCQDEFAPALDKLETCCKKLDTDRTSGHPLSFITQAETKMPSWKLFLTKSNCIGLGPAVTSPGDVRCIISGANVPYILGPFNHETCLMVGECYSQGVLRGEVVRRGNGREAQWCGIILE
jgi:hypothetical protein